MPYAHKSRKTGKWYALQSGGGIGPDVLGGPFETKREAVEFCKALAK